ncbi:MAG: hypothetical protein ISS49_18005 [Anaerolineae bacterium]|nr:hypothetical protein [Anaerolineae bacterium]
MPAPESTKERLQVDWLISSLRWLLLVSVALVISQRFSSTTVHVSMVMLFGHNDLRRDNTFVAEVEDDGQGFNVDAVQTRYDERGSLGMINMYERAELVSGKLTIVSAPGEGTRITLTAPLPGR